MEINIRQIAKEMVRACEEAIINGNLSPFSSYEEGVRDTAHWACFAIERQLQVIGDSCKKGVQEKADYICLLMAARSLIADCDIRIERGIYLSDGHYEEGIKDCLLWAFEGGNKPFTNKLHEYI